jgi:transcription factor MYB, plant
MPTAAITGAGHLDHYMNTNPLSKDNYVPRTASSNPGDVTQLIARRLPFAAPGSLNAGSSSSSSYASSMDNISKLLGGFMKSTTTQNDSATDVNPLLSFEHMSAGGTLPSFANILPTQPVLMEEHSHHEQPPQQQTQAPLSSIEKWLLDEATEQVDDLIDLSDVCFSY